MIQQDAQAYSVLIMVLKAEAPYDTGRLSQKGIRMVTDKDGMHIVIGHNTDRNYADYAVYTNEPWISPKWGGRKNPNEGWIERAIKRAIPMIKQVYDGMHIEDFNELMDSLQLEYIQNKVRTHNEGQGLR